MTKDHIYFLKECLYLAEKGQGKVSPNPMVGAILVYEEKIIGQGYHTHFSGPHAEVEAINATIENGHEDLISASTLYVNLEPCCHHGKTPPCTDLIIEKGIPHVVIAMQDPNPEVAGKGVEKLEKAGIDVELIDLPEAKELNKVFIKNITTSLPYVHLKIALTADNKLTAAKGTRTKLTTPEEDKCVHTLRNQYDGILIGKNTVVIDNPRLTCRLPNGRNPIRIILDSNGSLLRERYFKELNIFLGEGKNIIITTLKREVNLPKNTEVLTLPANENGQISPLLLLSKLFEKGITSILVEGGYQVIGSFLEEDAIDETTIFRSEILSSDPSVPTVPEVLT